MKNKKAQRFQAKYMHITLQKIKNSNKKFWLKKARSFRTNTVAVLVGIEQNEGEGKGVHAHLVIQFSTKQQISRKQFVEHFGTDSLHVSTKPGKDALMMALGYVSKTGNILQHGTFTHRGQPIETDPEIYRFHYQVRTIPDGIRYFHKVIKENMDSNKNIIRDFAKREDAIGVWLQQHKSVTNTLHKLAYTWYLDAQNERKTGFKFHLWVEDPKALKSAYMAYLEEFPKIFKDNLPTDSKLVLESDYDRHDSHDLDVLAKVIRRLNEAREYGSNRPLKYLNLYLWSHAPSFGKTRLLNFLDDHFMAYRLPDDQWYVDYENGMYQILVSDEAANFIKTKPYSHLKHIFEGQKVEFNLKGREKILKEDNPLIVLADNVSFDTLMEKYFRGWYQKDVMETRVLSLELKSRATLHFLLDRCIQSK